MYIKKKEGITILLHNKQDKLMKISSFKCILRLQYNMLFAIQKIQCIHS